MSNKTPYTYSILRYRHDVITGECINVGVVLLAPEHQYFDFRFSKKYGRLRKIFPDLDGKAFTSALNAIERGLKGINTRRELFLLSHLKTSKDFSEKVLRNDDSSFSWAEMGSGLTSDPKLEIKNIFERFVVWHENIKKNKRNDDDVWRPIREQLLKKNIAKQLHKRVVESDITSVTFEHTFQNGALHCYQPLSFDLSTEQGIQDKVAKWAGHLYHLRDSKQDFKPYFIVGKPSDMNMEGAYRDAVNALKDSPKSPLVYLEDDTDALISDIVDIIHSNSVKQSMI